MQLSKQNKVLAAYLADREVMDVLLDFSSFECEVVDILNQLRPLQPRYYSIASSFNKVHVVNVPIYRNASVREGVGMSGQ